MSRWDPGDKRQILRSMADDERRPRHERDAARRELNANQPAPSSRRARDAPTSQHDLDGEIENWYQRILPDANLTMSDRHEIRLNFDPSTQSIIDVFGNHLLWLFGQNVAEIALLIDLYGRTQSDYVRKKTLGAIEWIARYSPLDDARTTAKEFLDTTENQ